jgi:hypothetical protein
MAGEIFCGESPAMDAFLGESLMAEAFRFNALEGLLLVMLLSVESTAMAAK